MLTKIKIFFFFFLFFFGINYVKADIEIVTNFKSSYHYSHPNIYNFYQRFDTGGTITSKYNGGVILENNYETIYGDIVLKLYSENGTLIEDFNPTPATPLSINRVYSNILETETHIYQFGYFGHRSGYYSSETAWDGYIFVYNKYDGTYNYEFISGLKYYGFYFYGGIPFFKYGTGYYSFDGTNIVNLGISSSTIVPGTLFDALGKNYFGGGDDIVYIDPPSNTFVDRTFLITDGTILSASEQSVPLPLNNTEYTDYFLPIVDLALAGGNGGAGLSFINSTTGVYSSYNFNLGQFTYNASKFWYNMDYVNKTYLELIDYGSGTGQTSYSISPYSMNLIWKVTTSNLGSTENMYYLKDFSNSLWLRSDIPPTNNDVGGGGTGGGGSTRTNTTQPTNQTCTSQTFEINSGSGSNEIIYGGLSYSDMILSSSGAPIFRNYLSENDNLNLFNNSQLTFTGAFPDLTILKDLYIDYSPIGTNYPKEIEFYIGSAINANYSTSVIEVVLFNLDGTSETKNINTTFFGKSYKVSLSNLGYIKEAQIRITGIQNKIPSLQKIKFYGDKQRETKTRYQCTSGVYNCNWFTYFNPKIANYCEVNGDYNNVKTEFLEKTETTDTSWLDSIGSFFSNLGNSIVGRINGIISLFTDTSGNTGDVNTSSSGGINSSSLSGLGTSGSGSIGINVGDSLNGISTGSVGTNSCLMFGSGGNFLYYSNGSFSIDFAFGNYDNYFLDSLSFLGTKMVGVLTAPINASLQLILIITPFGNSSKDYCIMGSIVNYTPHRMFIGTPVYGKQTIIDYFFLLGFSIFLIMFLISIRGMLNPYAGQSAYSEERAVRTVKNVNGKSIMTSTHTVTNVKKNKKSNPQRFKV